MFLRENPIMAVAYTFLLVLSVSWLTLMVFPVFLIAGRPVSINKLYFEWHWLSVTSLYHLYKLKCHRDLGTYPSVIKRCILVFHVFTQQLNMTYELLCTWTISKKNLKSTHCSFLVMLLQTSMMNGCWSPPLDNENSHGGNQRYPICQVAKWQKSYWLL
jgi:hypothetical protein